MGHFEMARLQTPHLQMGVFQTVVTVACGLFPVLLVNSRIEVMKNYGIKIKVLEKEVHT